MFLGCFFGSGNTSGKRNVVARLAWGDVQIGFVVDNLGGSHAGTSERTVSPRKSRGGPLDLGFQFSHTTANRMLSPIENLHPPKPKRNPRPYIFLIASKTTRVSRLFFRFGNTSGKRNVVSHGVSLCRNTSRVFIAVSVVVSVVVFRSEIRAFFIGPPHYINLI